MAVAVGVAVAVAVADPGEGEADFGTAGDDFCVGGAVPAPVCARELQVTSIPNTTSKMRRLPAALKA
jgi:hypothetical protein